MSGHIKNARKVTIYQDPSRFTCQVGATQLANGDIIVVYNETRGLEHLDFDSIALMRSTDGGESWDPSSRVVVWPCTRTFGSDTPSIVQLSDGTLLCNFVMTAHVNTIGIHEDSGPQSLRLGNIREKDGGWLTRSTDNGYTWAPPYKASVAPMRWGQPIDEPLELPNGVLLMACSGKKYARPYEDPEARASFLLRSDNRGQDWEYYSTIAYDPLEIISFWEPALGRTADGVLVCVLRTLHAPRNRHGHLWVAYSTNDGESWSRPEPTNLWGYPGDLTLLQDGRMLCTYGHRRDPYGVRGCISKDGLHWDVADEFVIREGGEGPRNIGAWFHIGYPTSIQLKDGRIFSVDHQWTQEEPYVQYVVGVLWELAR